MNEKTVNLNEKPYLKPLRTFEKTGFVDPEKSYYVPLDNVVNSDNHGLKTMVDRGRYFSMFAPRQSGKTTLLEMFRKEWHQVETYVVLFLNFQNHAHLSTIAFYAKLQGELYPQLLNRLRDISHEKTETVSQFLLTHHLTNHLSVSRLFEQLNRILHSIKMVVLIDNFDEIPMDELEIFLISFRALNLEYKSTPKKALYTVGLIGTQNVIRLVAGGDNPYNISDHVDLPSFSFKNIQHLYAQYTAESNQLFTEAAVKKVYEETGGQPWLVNRMGTILTVNVKPETVEPIDEKDVDNAIALLLNEKNDHFDELYEKAKLYKETFVEIVFEHIHYYPHDKEQSWLEQYGLIKKQNGHVVVSNNIYKAVILNAFFKEAQTYREISLAEYTLPGNRLNMQRILLNFSQYIAQIGVRAFYQGDKPYEKTGQFLLTAWLYPFILGSAGELHYEVHTGLGRIDILLTYKGTKYIIETKVNHYTDISMVLAEGIIQVTGKYLATENTIEGYLVIFDPRTPVGTAHGPEYHQVEDKKVTSITIGIGRHVR